MTKRYFIRRESDKKDRFYGEDIIFWDDKLQPSRNGNFIVSDANGDEFMMNEDYLKTCVQTEYGVFRQSIAPNGCPNIFKPRKLKKR